MYESLKWMTDNIESLNQSPPAEAEYSRAGVKFPVPTSRLGSEISRHIARNRVKLRAADDHVVFVTLPASALCVYGRREERFGGVFQFEIRADT